MTNGHVENGFEGVADAFERNFKEHGEVGASCAVFVEGRTVVDVWGGVADPASQRPWTEDTIVTVFSCSKGAVAACANLLIDRGELDVDAPIASYWPEFAANGKGDIPVRWALCHKAGIPVIDKRVTREDILGWDGVVAAVAEQPPVWEPGTKHGYHALTYGWIVGELVRRITARTIGAYFREEFGDPLGLSWWIGLPPSEEHRVATTIGYPGGGTIGGAAKESLMARSMALLRVPRDVNDPVFHAAEIPAATGISDARSMARLYSALVEGETPLSRSQLDAARVPQTSGPDAVISVPGLIDIELTFGLGFMTASPFCRFGVPGAFGHNGAGGALGFGDPTNRVGFGYAMNQMLVPPGADPRPTGLVRAVYDSIGVEAPFT